MLNSEIMQRKSDFIESDYWTQIVNSYLKASRKHIYVKFEINDTMVAVKFTALNFNLIWSEVVNVIDTKLTINSLKIEEILNELFDGYKISDDKNEILLYKKIISATQ